MKPTAIVTGASRGIGLELVRESLAKGDQVLAVARNPSDAAGLKDLQKKYSTALFVCAADVASLVAILCSSRARYITGERIHVDGGMHHAV